MIFNKYRSLIAALAVAFLASCTLEVDDFQPSSGADKDGKALNFTSYVALGNSLTAGVTDNAWMAKSQVNSYPQLIANKLQEVGLGAQGFNQPLISHSGEEYFGAPFILTSQGPCFSCKTPKVPTSNIYQEHANGGFHNMAVSGMKAVEVNNPALAAGLYGYFASAPGQSTVLSDALSLDPTFFSMWLGANDVLGYATTGGSMGPGAITSQSDYEAAVGMVLDSMDARGAKGVLLNIPDITNAALFQTTPNTLEKMLVANGMELTDEFLALVNGYLASAFDPVIRAQIEAGRSTIVSLLTPIPAAGNANTIAIAVNTAPNLGKDPSVAADLAYTVVYLGAYNEALGMGASMEQAHQAGLAYAASAEGQANIAQLVALGIDQSWATMTGTDEEVDEIIDNAVTSTIAQLKVAGYYPEFTAESNQLPVYDATSPTMLRVPAEGTIFSLAALTKIIALGELILSGGDLDITKLKDYLPVNDATASQFEFLEAADVNAVKSAIDGYNTYLNEQASARDLAYVDVKSVMDEAASGIIIDGVTFSTAYISGNLFSLDGAHLTQRGYAVIANFVIDAVNNKYGSKIPTVQQNDYPVIEESTPDVAPSN
ncbi:hypothetical protein KMW28_01660 [Flammeovirga yaeyamensis]|uniref:G-D-S-L family lipolytic protein n=1 Tax=Flammeovirga yaeyamensis TaxID=367791 RepID=A0AAX1N8F9_9BACT|nr:hypothetical protein [Flammeovirga yaeyamensis]MBB3699793.1 lysophospholipase L1-like esterase [Flammeovirga yaeyamensis]NMF36638.1 hypothetical protein [Flammeovirga yaeyamensis]QWG02317.1 hypothetical protein KMW28_01660 [Flammeovirga yaeyamensis]